MPAFGVTPRKEAELLQRMSHCGLREEDLEERFVTSGGPGGQKANRSSTCVRLRHVPSGLDVKMRAARSQALNRFYARRRMCELLEARQLAAASPEAQERGKVHKQKARRHRRSRRKLPPP